MSMSFHIKRGDTGRPLVVDLSYSDGTQPNLAGAAGQFLMRLVSDTALTVNAAASLDNTAKTATYEWVAGDVATVGHYLGEFEVTYGDGTVETFPSRGYIRVHIREDLGDAP